MRVRLQTGLPILALLVAPAARAQRPNMGQWMNSNVLKRMHVTGRRTVGMQFQSVQGDQQAFGSLTNYGQGLNRFTDQGSMNVTGQGVLGFLDFSVAMNDNRFQDPQNEQFTLRYNRNGINLAYGTVQGTLGGGNPLVAFSRSLKGTVGGYTSGRSSFSFVRSQARGEARTVTLEGNNSPGPYYLQSGRIVNDSLRVLLDGQVQRLGIDFNLNADLGAITFIERSVAPTSALVVSYEAFGIGSAQSSVEGMAGAYNLGRWGRVGVTTVRQTAPESSSTSLYLDKFQGYGSPDIPYSLTFVPLAGTVEVRVNGVVQIQGAQGVGDYYFSPGNPTTFFFNRAVSSGQTVDVRYRPRPNSTGTGGNRTVTGVDLTIPIARARKFDGRAAARLAMRRGVVGGIPLGFGVLLDRQRNYGDDASGAAGSYIQAYAARGASSLGYSGMGRGVQGQYDLNGYVFRGSVRDIPATFVSVESAGFNRNERASEFSVSKNLGHGLSARADTSNSLVSTLANPSGIGTGVGTEVAGTTVIPTRVTSTGATLTYDGGSTRGGGTGGVRWTAAYRRDRSDRNLAGSRVDTRLDTTSLTAGRRVGRLGFSAGLDRQTGFGPTTLDGTTKMSSVGIDSIRSNLDYFLGRSLTLTGRASLSRVSADSRSGSGTDTSATLTLAPVGNWQASATYANSNSGALATLGGFGSGFAAGYTGSGFSGTTTASNAYGGSNLRLFSTNATYRAGDRLSLTGRFYDQTSQGTVTSNATTRAYGIAGTYDLHGGNLVNVSLDRSATSFFSTGSTTSNSTTLDLFLAGNPRGPWSYRFGVNTLVSAGGQYAQSSSGFDASLSHRIDDRQRLTLAGNFGRVRGYYPQDDSALALLYDYRLFGNVALTGAYRWRDMTNLDPSLVNGAFRSSGFSLELSFDFSR